MNRVIISLFSILALATVLLVYNFQLEEETPVASDSVIEEISLYHYFSGSLSGGIQAMVETVNEQRQNQRVTASALDHEAFKSMVHSTLASGSPPELFTYWAGAKTQALVDKGYLEPIDDLWEKASLDSRFPSAIAESASTYNNKKYLVPITQHLVVFFYNKKLFEDAGLEPPANWREFLVLCENLKRSGLPAIALGARERWPAQFWFDYLLLRTAGPRYRAALMDGGASYDDKEVVEVYRLWAELIGNGYFNDNAAIIDWPEATEMVCKGEAAFTLMGTWAIQLLTGTSCGLEEEIDFDYFVFPVIDSSTPGSSVGPIDGIVLTSESSHHELAKTVLAYFAKSDAQKNMSRGSGALAPSNDIPQEFYSPIKQRLFDDIQASDNWAFNYDLATPPEVAELGMDSFSELLAYPDQYQEIVSKLETDSRPLFTPNKAGEASGK